MSRGPPGPPARLTLDEWIARVATLPLMDHPGAAWRYSTRVKLLGGRLGLASRRPLGAPCASA